MAQIPEIPAVITSAAFAAKFKSKYEIYNFLTIEVKAYMPPYENITIVSIPAKFLVRLPLISFSCW